MPCRNISRRPCNKATFAPPPLPPQVVSSLLRRKVGASDLALTTEDWTKSLWSTSISYLWSLWPWHPFGRSLSSQNLISTVRIILYTFEKATNGRPPSVPHYEYLLMPYGLSCAPSAFKNLINDILCDFVWTFIIAYIDDILIYSPNLELHVTHVKEVLSRLLHHQLCMKAEKWEFHMHQSLSWDMWLASMGTERK